MYSIIHISDLHFGGNDPKITEQLRQTINGLTPDMVAVSGDLTMRARVREFEEAKLFLEALPGRQIVVPGNHDVSLYNVFRRFFKPLERFQQLISPEESFFAHEEAVIIGLNSSRSFTIKGGSLSPRQLEKAHTLLSSEPGRAFKIVVTHHPISEMPDKILNKLMELGVNIFISGHRHKSSIQLVSREIQGETRTALLVAAGTATSVRYRNELNSFNRLIIKGQSLAVQNFTWQSAAEGFVMIAERKFIDN